MKTPPLFLLLLLISFGAAGEPERVLCTYETYANQDGVHQDGLAIAFLIDGNKAYILGKNGANEVTAIPNLDGVTLIEVTSVGNVTTTTIVKGGRSVHSRNSVSFGKIVPSQYYGSCDGLGES